MKINRLFLSIAILTALSHATYDLFPVPQGTGGSVRQSNTLYMGNEDASDDDENDWAGRHALEGRFFTHNFELYVQLFGGHWDAFHSSYDLCGALDFAFGLKYQINPIFSAFMDIDGIPYGTDEVNIRHLKFGAQFSGQVNSVVTLASEVGFKNPFEREYDKDHLENRYGAKKLTWDQGGILNFTFEADFKIKRVILFALTNFEVQLNDTEFKLYSAYDDEKLTAKDGSGDILFDFIYGINVITGQFNLELNQGLRVGDLRELTYAPGYVFTLGVILKYNI